MKIGALNINSQFNSYSAYSLDSLYNVQKVDKVEKNDKVESKVVKEEPAAALSLTGGDLFKTKSAVYKKYSANGTVLKPEKVEELDDFSLVSAKEDKIHSRKPVASEFSNYKEIISDDEMDSFLKKAFKLYESNE